MTTTNQTTGHDTEAVTGGGCCHTPGGHGINPDDCHRCRVETRQPTGRDTNHAHEERDALRIHWTTSQKYIRTFTASQMVELAESLRCEPNPDAIHEALDSGDWKAEETMHELASERYWSDSGEAEVSDVEDLTLDARSAS